MKLVSLSYLIFDKGTTGGKQMNKFVSKYKELRNKGYSDLEAMGMVSCHVSTYGSMKDLETLYIHHLGDVVYETEKVLKELEELTNERITTTV